MDRIFIDRLQVFGRHGVLKEENTLGQMFFISAEIFAELRTAGKNDDISQTVIANKEIYINSEYKRYLRKKDIQTY